MTFGWGKNDLFLKGKTKDCSHQPCRRKGTGSQEVSHQENFSTIKVGNPCPPTRDGFGVQFLVWTKKSFHTSFGYLWVVILLIQVLCFSVGMSIFLLFYFKDLFFSTGRIFQLGKAEAGTGVSVLFLQGSGCHLDPPGSPTPFPWPWAPEPGGR